MTAPPLPPRASWQPLLERALAEDLGTGDATSTAVLAADACAEGVLEARQDLVVCGLPIACAAFEAVDASLVSTARGERDRVGAGSEVDAALVCETARGEGDRVGAGAPLLRIRGPARSLLAAERTALNFVTRLAGVATLTRRYVEAVAGTGVEILDTRKTLPGWRVLDKYAVATGGGRNHRFGLYDAILIKDNHIAAAGGVGAAVKAARASAPGHLAIQVEVESEAQAAEAVEAGARLLLLDNRTPDELRQLAERFRDRAVLEASGGITLSTVRAVAETGVHRISIGALTHSAPGADVALELREA